MKKLYFLSILLVAAFGLHAQHVYNDYDANRNETFSGWPNAVVTVANPDASGINTSDSVAMWERSTEQWANVYSKLAGPVDLSVDTVFHLKVYSPIVCQILFKLENQNDASQFVQVFDSITATGINKWVQLDFAFARNSNSPFNQITLFFDFSTTTNNTFYFDDVEGPDIAGASFQPYTLPIDFETEPNVLTDFGGNSSSVIVDPTNSSNMVAQTIKTETAEFWAGTTMGVNALANPIPFTANDTKMSVRVWSPDAGTPVRLKVEDADDPTISVETEVNTTVANDWDTLVFDFSQEATGTAPLNLDNTYNKASIFFNFGTTGADAGAKTYYWDDVTFIPGGSQEKPLADTDVQDNFENDGTATITNWKFQDPDMNPLMDTLDPTDNTNHVAYYYRSGAFQYTNAQTILDHRLDLSQRNVFKLRVYFPSTNDYTGALTPTVSVKLQNSLLGGNAWTTQTEIKDTVTTFDEWETFEFDFSGIADSVNYDQIVVQLGGEGHNVPGLFYFDDFELKDVSGIPSQQMLHVTVSPNPVTNQFRIEGISNIQSVRIYTLTGQKVFESFGNEPTVQFGSFTSGLYLISVTNQKGQTYTAKILKR